VLKFDVMISKVKPIVDYVRAQGDAALLDLTAKYDKARLDSTVLLPPFAPETLQLDTAVRAAIDVAYANIRKFHEAQASADTLVVETMPGVVCSRFARPIARVGLYVPGGTAILPSTALMLGIPAQVAGCREIVLATPPRPDGSISPEVMYVAHLVGASAVLKAGGAQAVAALAYGTQTVPKVDKIFGPGNQWVTAAKMLVQNDTDALVAIDMPAGPSEVLVSFSHYPYSPSGEKRMLISVDAMSGHRGRDLQSRSRGRGSAFSGRARRRFASGARRLGSAAIDSFGRRVAAGCAGTRSGACGHRSRIYFQKYHRACGRHRRRAGILERLRT
jgi:hypothetical protein